jgi:hypothetical protein
MYRVKEAYGINEALLKILAKQDETWETALLIWEKTKLLRLDALTSDQLAVLENIEMDLQEQEHLYLVQLMAQQS